MRKLLAFSAVLLALATPVLAQQPVAIKAGKVITNQGAVLQDGMILIRGGRITAIGKDLEVPFDAILHEWPDGVVFPGFYQAHSSSGMDRSNENVPVAPFLDVRDSIDPVQFYFEDELREGVVGIGIFPGNNTIIGGRGRVVAPFGMTVEEMTLHAGPGMKIAFGPRSRTSRSAQMAELRDAIDKLEDALERKGQALLDEEAARKDQEKAGNEAPEEDESDGDAFDDAGGYVRFGDDFPGKDLISEQDLSAPDRGLAAILNGEVPLWMWCPTPTDVHHGIDWCREHGLIDQAVFVVSPSAWKAAELLQDANRPVALTQGLWHSEDDPVTGEEILTFVPKILHEHGIAFSIASQEGLLGPSRLGHQAAVCVREGVPRRVAMAAVTTVPASMWGLQDRLGVLKEGADGTFAVMSADPLDAGATTLQVWVRGRQVYDRAKDERLQRLLEGENK